MIEYNYQMCTLYPFHRHQSHILPFLCADLWAAMIILEFVEQVNRMEAQWNLLVNLAIRNSALVSPKQLVMIHFPI